MERYAWKGKIKAGKLDEYIKRHKEIWPELTELLNLAGIHNYTVWNCGLDLFGYFECDYGVEYAQKAQAESEVVNRWNEYMKDILELEMDPKTGAQPMMKQVFFHK